MTHSPDAAVVAKRVSRAVHSFVLRVCANHAMCLAF